jgi:hypothetical protein
MKITRYYDNPELPDRYTAISSKGDVFAFSKDSPPDYQFNIVDSVMTHTRGYGWERVLVLSEKQCDQIICEAIEDASLISQLGTKIRFHSLPECAKNFVRRLKLSDESIAKT